MIAKCIAVFAVVAQISASGCGCGQPAVILANCDQNPRSSPITLVSSVSPGSPFADSFATAPLARNIAAKGRYPVALRNCEPVPAHQIPVTSSHITTPTQERPTVRLPANIPLPRTICHTCTCYKTILRPAVHDQYVTVPTVHRYVETGHKPVIENIQYEAVPFNCDRAGYALGPRLRLLEVGAGSSSGCIKLVNSGCACSEAVPVPQVQVVEVPRVQVPEIQTVQIPQPVSFGCVSQC